MLKKINEIYQNAVAQFNFVHLENLHPAITSKKCLQIYFQAATKFTSFEKNFNFQNAQNEISYFKKIKAPFIADFLYFTKIAEIERSKLVSEVDKDFFQIELNKIIFFKIENIDFFNFYKSNDDTKDLHFFKKENCSELLYDEEIYFCNKDRANYDIILAHFIANEKIDLFIANQLATLKFNSTLNLSLLLDIELTKTEVSELALAMYFLKCLPESNTSINSVSKSYANFHNVEIRLPHEYLHEISNRTGSKAIFLEKLINALVNKINEKYK